MAANCLSKTLAAHCAAPPLWHWRGKVKSWQLDFNRPTVMGIVNVTHDSFSGDGSQTVQRAIAQGLQMARDGADILDIGGESTRPGADPVSLEEELRRVVEVVRTLSETLDIPISVDSSKPEVMEAVLEAGAALINDVTALAGDPGQSRSIAAVLAEADCPLILMHMRGKPATMQQAPHYDHVLSEVYGFLAERMDFCLENGIKPNRLMVDPGIGFGKEAVHNLTLMSRQRTLCGLGAPLLLGLSRKRIVGQLAREPVANRRDVGSHVLAALGYLAGAAVFRVHDVAGAKQALSVASGWWNGLEETV
ncbi:MAG: dihydropteroate synthase [Magnetococcales bacterium]|nr:dihydropteroate synthase [Magnetococcales bacterium]